LPAHPGAAWREAYGQLLAELPTLAARSRITLCGFSVCVDARCELHDLTSLLTATDPQVAAYATMLLERAARGTGGEVRVDWSAGPAWLNAHEKFQYALGGTGPQAAWVLSKIGAPALVALEDRSAHTMAQIPGSVLLVENGEMTPVRDVKPRGPQRPDNYIIEYTKGRAVRGVVPPRSSRIISRFYDFGIEHDPGFVKLSLEIAGDCGTGLVSGFNAVPHAMFEDELRYIYGLSRGWLRAGLATVHFELAGYVTPDLRDRSLEACTGAVTSLGMSYSEFTQIAGEGTSLKAGLRTLAERLGLSRVCVHADEWAASITTGDPATEQKALMMGCLLASCRAEAGRPVNPAALPPLATFDAPPIPEFSAEGPWNYVSCSSPYLATPASTLGLGDTFTAGCLLVLGLEPEASTTLTRPTPASTGPDTFGQRP